MKLQNFTILLLTAVVVSQASTGQSKVDKIVSIRQTLQKINSDSSLKKKTIDDTEEFLGHTYDGGGQLVGYFHKDSVCKIFCTVGLSYGMINDEYYFSRGKLIFVYETEKDFPYSDSLGGLDFNKLNLAFEGRYYFDNDRLVEKIIKGKRRFENQEDNPATFITDAKNFVRLIKTKGR